MRKFQIPPASPRLGRGRANSKFQINSGQTLVEVLFAMGIVAVCLVALIIAVVASIRNVNFAKESALASQYTREALEVARKERDNTNSWDDFTTDFSGNRGLNINLAWGVCPATPNVGIFIRCVNFNNSGDKSTVTATVSWIESGRTHTSQAVTFLTKWGQ